MSIPLVILAGYIVLLYAVSWAAAKRSRGILGFLLAGRGFPAGIVAVMVAGLAIGGASTIGVAENAYTSGISAGWYNGAWAAGAVVVGLVAAGRYRKLEVSTVPEILGRSYDTPGRIIGVVGQIIIQVVITSLQYVAGGAILSALLPDVFTPRSGMLVSAATFVGITLIGGYWAAGLSNVINVVVIYVGIVAGAVLCVRQAGGPAAIAAALPPGEHWLDPVGGVGGALVGAWFAVMITQAFSTQAVTQIAFAAKDGRSARLGFVLGGLLIFPVGFICALFGIVAASRFPGITPALALPRTLLALHPLAAGLALAGLWAADVSTAVGLLLGSSTLIIEDVWKRLFPGEITERRQFWLSRGITLLISAVTYALAVSVAGILKTLLLGLTLTASYTIVLLFTIYVPGLCRRGSAFWTILAGILFLALWQLVPQIRIAPHPIYLAWPVGLLAFLAVRLVDRRPIGSMAKSH